MLRYTSFPPREHWLPWLVLAALLGLIYFLLLAVGAAMGLAAAAALAFTLRRLWAPTVCEIDARGVGVGLWKVRRRVYWDEIGRCRVGSHGVVLLPSSSSSSGYHTAFGLYLPFADHRREVLAMIERRVRRTT